MSNAFSDKLVDLWKSFCWSSQRQAEVKDQQRRVLHLYKRCVQLEKMKNEPEIFKYQKGKKIGEILTMVSIVTLIVFILDSNGSEITKILLTILMTVFLIFMISYTYLLNENFQIDSEALTIKKKIGNSNKIPFKNIRRVTIREKENSVETNHFAMTVFERNKNTRIIVSDLDNRFKMINLFEQKGRDFGFNVIHQNINGKIIREIKKRKTGHNKG
ncbi:hypothetical protein WAF17_08230 [Bernardetia sp. ABR2-2B]|uniref:hypothetical protein n=1 Tax=Bernardetia sp. ABR2-2B TaxID=3127472 RepID=UPI0030CB6E75